MTAAQRTRKVALFAPDLGGGGAERMFRLLANALHQRGFQVEVVLNRAIGVNVPLLATGIGIHELGAKRMASAIRPLARYLARSRPSCLFSTNEHANIAAAIAHLVAGARTKLILREANVLSVYARSSRNKTVKLARYLAPLLYRRADAIVAVGHAVRDDLVNRIGIPSNRVHVIYNVATSRDAHMEGMFSHRHYAIPSVPLILSVGRLSKQKDFETLIRAFARVLNSRVARLEILGEGPERDRLERLAKELGIANYVQLRGFSRGAVERMAECNLFVLSSAWEGCSNALLEAMSVGAPIVATDCPGASREVLDGGGCGRLVPVGDVETMARAMIETIGPAGSNTAAAKRSLAFSTEAIVSKYVDLIEPKIG